MTPGRMLELSRIFADASGRQTNVIDPPFNCVCVNLTPSTWRALAEWLEEMARRAGEDQR